MEPITLIDASFTHKFHLPAKDDAHNLLTDSPAKLYDKEFIAIFMLTVVLPKIAKLGIHSPDVGKNVVLIVDDRNTFAERYTPAFFSLMCHSSTIIDVIDQHDNVADAAKNIIALNGNNACFMIFNTPCHNVEEIVNIVKPISFSFVQDISRKEDSFTHFIGLQYAVPHCKFLRMFVVLESDGTYWTNKYDLSRMLNMMLDVALHFNHKKWIDSIVNIFEHMTIGMRSEVFQLRRLLSE